jgi:hypothetical protein
VATCPLVAVVNDLFGQEAQNKHCQHNGCNWLIQADGKHLSSLGCVITWIFVGLVILSATSQHSALPTIYTLLSARLQMCTNVMETAGCNCRQNSDPVCLPPVALSVLLIPAADDKLEAKTMNRTNDGSLYKGERASPVFNRRRNLYQIIAADS